MNDNLQPVESGALAGLLVAAAVTVLGCGLCALLTLLISVMS